MKIKKSTYLLLGVLFIGAILACTSKNHPVIQNLEIGQEVDSFNDVAVYYNGGVGNVSGRNTTKDGYNLGLKFQCVEFVKRYYYEYLNHKMPDSYGHAKDFYNPTLLDGQMSTIRNLHQYSNPSKWQPEVNDLVIFAGHAMNQYGHVAIISKVSENEIEIIQQNPGPTGKSRETFSLEKTNGKWKVNDSKLLGWLRKN